MAGEGTIKSINPNEIRFSQNSVNGAAEITTSMEKNGWQGETMLKDIEQYEKALVGFEFPESYLKVLKLKLVNYDFWYLMNANQIQTRRVGLSKRFPKRNLVPFARRDDNDDIACFEIGYGEKVFIIHDFASERWEKRQEFDTFWIWFISAIKELIGIE